MNKTLRDLLAPFILEHGLVMVRGKRHWKVKHPSGRCTTVSDTPSDRRALDNIHRDLRRLCQGDPK
jgi:hypothetical protein